MSMPLPTPAARLPLASALSPLLVALAWAFQVRFPPLSYPALGQIPLLVLAGIVLLGTAALFRGRRVEEEGAADAVAWGPCVMRRHPALLPGMLFICWVIGRWMADGAPADATADVSTVLWAGVYFVATLLAAGHGARLQFPSLFLKVLCLAGLVCGVYAVMQYHVLYRATYASLMESIGSRLPDRTEAALLHHLGLRRVASFWGDPNSYAAFAALAVAAGMEVWATVGRWRVAWRVVAACSMAAGLAGIYYTGSRGGVLDLVIVAVLFGICGLIRRRRGDGRAAGFSAAALVFLLLVPRGVPAEAGLDVAAPTADAPETGWIWRSDTIRERLYYLQVGEKMIRLAPLAGLGPGSVNDYFGRLKSPYAREARHLHNWFVNTWAELGAVGVGLLCWFLIAIAWAVWRRGVLFQPIGRAYAVMFVVIVFDGLLQTSWAQRELMSLMGIVCGCLVCMTRREEVAPAGRYRLWLRAGAAAGLVGIYLIIEVPFLTAANAKQIAEDAMLGGDVALATKYWEKASRWAPRDPEPYQARAQMALEQGRLSAARMLFQHALRLSPDSAVLNTQLAMVMERLKEPALAEKHLQRALELYPSNPAYNLQYAEFLAGTGRRAEAISYAERAAKYSYLPEQKAEIDDFLRTVR